MKYVATILQAAAVIALAWIALEVRAVRQRGLDVRQAGDVVVSVADVVEMMPVKIDGAVDVSATSSIEPMGGKITVKLDPYDINALERALTPANPHKQTLRGP